MIPSTIQVGDQAKLPRKGRISRVLENKMEQQENNEISVQVEQRLCAKTDCEKAAFGEGSQVKDEAGHIRMARSESPKQNVHPMPTAKLYLHIQNRLHCKDPNHYSYYPPN